MPRRKASRSVRLRAAACALGWLMLVPILPLHAPVSGSPPPFGAGDWIVTGAETLKDTSLLLDGNLVIQNGGALTVTNSSITVHCKVAEEHEVRVMAGGTLNVLDGSVMSAFDPLKPHGFWIDSGSVARFRDSTFVACGIAYAQVNQQAIGGIVSRTDSLSVIGCSFIGAQTALTLYAGAQMVRSSFVQNYIGVEILGAPMEFRDCRFERNTMVASWPYQTTIDYTNCTFVNNSIGVSSDASLCYFTDCRFDRQTAAAVYASSLMQWYMPPSTFVLEDCVFEGNFVGIGHYPDVGRHRLTMKNCDILNSTRYGIEWGNRGWDGTPGADFTLWNTTKSSRILNSKCIFNGQMSVGNGGNLTIHNSNLSFDGDWAGELQLLVQPGGRLALENGTVVRALDASVPYGLRCRPGSAFFMDGAVIRGCGWDSSQPESSGPLLETSDVRIFSSTIDLNPVALAFNGSRGALIEGSSLRGNERGLDLDSSSVMFRNSTLAAIGGNSASLGRGSLLDCVNPVLDRGRLEFLDIASRANFSWSVDVRAMWADKSPVPGANLTIQDKNGGIVDQTLTGADGNVRGTVLMEASVQRDTVVNFTPHAFNCSKGKIWNQTAIAIKKSCEITLVLADTARPSMNITYPSEGSYHNIGELIVMGAAQDNIGVARIDLSVDGYMRQRVFESDGLEPEQLEWNASLTLEDGYHSIDVTAWDPAGNQASAYISVWVDTQSPRIRIANPQENHLTNISLVTVSGFMEPGTRVYICGTELRTERDTFSGVVVLSEGPNLITATAADAAGNSNSSSVTVRLDSASPRLDVQTPRDGLQTRFPTVEVAGSMEPGSEVYVNGRQVALGADPGAFRTVIALTREMTTVTVDAVDIAGNHNFTARKVVLDTRPPFLRLLSPVDGSITNNPSAVLEGEAEAGSMLMIAGASLQIQGSAPSRTSFSVPVQLHEGLNTFVITALDAAGNQNSSSLHLTLDTVPPPLTIVSPGNGSRTAASTVLIEGETEPGVMVTVNGQPVPVGRTGSFSLEVRLSSGGNRIAVRAQDAAGNTADASVSVQRVPSQGEVLMSSEAGPDWRFVAFFALAVAAVAAEGLLVSRYLRGQNARASREGGG